MFIRATDSIDDFPLSKVNWARVKQKGYDYFKIPVEIDLRDISIDDTSDRKLCLNKLYELFLNLKDSYQKKFIFAKPVIMINSGQNFNWQVIMFFNKEAYHRFFVRNAKDQTWKRGNKRNPWIDQLDIKEYHNLNEIHYHEMINDPDEYPSQQENDIWFYQ